MKPVLDPLKCMVGIIVDEVSRAERLLAAQEKAAALFIAAADRELVAAGESEHAVSDRIRDLANEMFGPTRHWHSLRRLTIRLPVILPEMSRFGAG